MGRMMQCALHLLLFVSFLLSFAAESAATSAGCQRTVSCGFEQSMCGFTTPSNGNNWFRVHHHYGIPDGRGYYIYSAKSYNYHSAKLNLTSPPLCQAATVNVAFIFVLTKTQSDLQVTTQCQGQQREQRDVSYSFNYRAIWRQANFSLQACSDSDTTVIFRGTMARFSGTGSIALDDIKIQLSPLPTTTTTTPTTTTTTTETPTTQQQTTQPPSTELPTTTTTMTTRELITTARTAQPTTTTGGTTASQTPPPPTTTTGGTTAPQTPPPPTTTTGGTTAPQTPPPPTTTTGGTTAPQTPPPPTTTTGGTTAPQTPPPPTTTSSITTSSTSVTPKPTPPTTEKPTITTASIATMTRPTMTTSTSRKSTPTITPTTRKAAAATTTITPPRPTTTTRNQATSRSTDIGATTTAHKGRPASSKSADGDSNKVTYIVVGTVLGTVVLIAVIAVVVFFVRRRLGKASAEGLLGMDNMVYGICKEDTDTPQTDA